VRQFSPPHLAALAVLVITSIVGVALARRYPGRPTTVLCRGLAVVIFAAWAGEYVADAVTGIWTIQYDLPLQLTDTISVVSAIALWTRRRSLAEIVYLWALSASLQATITPDLDWTFPSIFYFTYFIYHEGAIVAGLVLVFGCGLYPRPWAWLRTFAATLLVAACAGTADALIPGADYMFLASKPPYASLFNVLGPWPWYIISVAGVAIAMVLILQAIAGALRRIDPAA
jgi:hypothetical integral membrane protein (TIGR02206 family)